jgi:hypothetical protein
MWGKQCNSVRTRRKPRFRCTSGDNRNNIGELSPHLTGTLRVSVTEPDRQCCQDTQRTQKHCVGRMQCLWTSRQTHIKLSFCLKAWIRFDQTSPRLQNPFYAGRTFIERKNFRKAFPRDDSNWSSLQNENVVTSKSQLAISWRKQL